MSEPATLLCGGCREAGRCRLGAGDFTFDEAVTRAPVVCAEKFHAGPKVAHGGWTAALFDDVMGRALGQRGAKAVTASLTVDFLKPVPVEEPLVIEVRVVSHVGRRWEVTSMLSLAAGDAPLARAKGLWLERRHGHFERHEEAMDAYRRDKAGD
jgi:uncharacterized protein (TIGR00369 family)